MRDTETAADTTLLLLNETCFFADFTKYREDKASA